MRCHPLVFAAAALLVLSCSGCKDAVPPSPSYILNNTRDRLTPFRFTLTTDPVYPKAQGVTGLKVHVINGSNEPVTGVELIAELSTNGGSSTLRRITLDDRGHGDYEGEVQLETAGNWAVDLRASKEDKIRSQRFYIDVGE